MDREHNKRKRGAGDDSPSENFYLPYPDMNKKRNVEYWLQFQSPASLSTPSETKEDRSDEELPPMFEKLSLSAEAKEFIPQTFPGACVPVGLLSDGLTVKEEPKDKSDLFYSTAKLSELVPEGSFSENLLPNQEKWSWYNRSTNYEQSGSQRGMGDVEPTLPLIEKMDTETCGDDVESPPLESGPGVPTLQSPEESYARLDVYTDEKVGFVNDTVYFVIRLVNVPAELALDARMFLATVHTPTDKVINCRVWSAAVGQTNYFRGAFQTKDEVGKYSLLVRMTVPGKHLTRFRGISEMGDGIIRGSTRLNVSRNYAEDIFNKSSKVKCEFVDTTNMWNRRQELQGSPGLLGHIKASVRQSTPEVKSKLWGLTCNFYNNHLLYTDRHSNKIICTTPTGATIFKCGDGVYVPSPERLNRPTGITVDHIRNRLVICDKDNHRICFFSLDGKFISTFGGRGFKNGLFEYPWDVAVSPKGDLVVTDSGNKRVQFFDHLGNYLTKYTVFEVFPVGYRTQFDNPRGICYDSTGANVFVTDYNLGNVICVPVDVTGHYHLLAKGTGALSQPQGIAMDASENLLVADSRHNCLRHLSNFGEHLSTIRKIGNYPVNVTTMAGGTVAVLSGDGIINIF